MRNFYYYRHTDRYAIGSAPYTPLVAADIQTGFTLVQSFTQSAQAFLQSQRSQADADKKRADQIKAYLASPQGQALSDAERQSWQTQADELFASSNALNAQWGTGSPGGLAILAFIGAASGSVGNASGQAGMQFVQDAALYALQGLGAQQIKGMIDYLTAERIPGDPSSALLSGPAGEAARALLQGLLGCATQAGMSNGSCAAGAFGAGGAVVINNVLDALFTPLPNTATNAQRQERENLINTLLLGMAAGTPALANNTAGVLGSGTVELENNGLSRNDVNRMVEQYRLCLRSGMSAAQCSTQMQLLFESSAGNIRRAVQACTVANAHYCNQVENTIRQGMEALFLNRANLSPELFERYLAQAIDDLTQLTIRRTTPLTQGQVVAGYVVGGALVAGTGAGVYALSARAIAAACAANPALCASGADIVANIAAAAAEFAAPGSTVGAAQAWLTFTGAVAGTLRLTGAELSTFLYGNATRMEEFGRAIAESERLAKLIEAAQKNGQSFTTYAEQLVQLSTQWMPGSNANRAVLGGYGQTAGYIEEATRNGGYFFSTLPGSTWVTLEKALGPEKFFQYVNAPFLENMLRLGVPIEYAPGTATPIINGAVSGALTPSLLMETQWLIDNAARYGYSFTNGKWVKL